MVGVVRLSATAITEGFTEAGTTATVGKRLGGFGPPFFNRNMFLATSSREVAAATIYAAKLTELLPASTRGGRADIVLDLTYNAATNQGHSSRGKPCGKS